MNCEQVEERLSAYLDDMLTLEERQEIAIHLQACRSCVALLDELRQNDLLLAQLPRVSPRPALQARLFSAPEMLVLVGSRQRCLSLPYRCYRWARPLASLHLVWRGNRLYLVRLPNGRSAGLYRCTQRRGASPVQERTTKCCKVKIQFVGNHSSRLKP